MNEAIFKSNINEIIASWKKKPVAMIKAMERGLYLGLRQFEGQRIIRGQLSGRKSANYGLNRQSGNAANATDVRMVREGLDSVGYISVADRAWYLKVHQHYKFDGYIRPKNATSLAVPVSPQAKGKRPADFGGTLVFIKRPGKAPLLIKEVRKGGSSKTAGKVRPIIREDIMFVLKPHIYVPKRLYLYEEFKTYGKEMIRKNIINQLESTSNATE